MQAVFFVSLIVFSFAATAQGSAVKEESAIGKVIELISSLEAKIIKEGTVSQKTYDEFAEWCEDRSKEFGFEIKTLTSEKEELEATVANSKAKIEELTTKIADLTGEVAEDEKDLNAATEIRGKE